jgi:hypothetical protein
MLNISAFLGTLPVMLYGLLGIFIVIGFIILCVKLLTIAFPVKKGK